MSMDKLSDVSSGNLSTTELVTRMDRPRVLEDEMRAKGIVLGVDGTVDPELWQTVKDQAAEAAAILVQMVTDQY